MARNEKMSKHLNSFPKKTVVAARLQKNASRMLVRCALTLRNKYGAFRTNEYSHPPSENLDMSR